MKYKNIKDAFINIIPNMFFDIYEYKIDIERDNNKKSL